MATTELRLDSLHVTTAEFDELRRASLFVRPLAQLEPVIHLARNCPQCWATANALPEFEYDDNTPQSGEPVVECLRRVGTSRSWPLLSADHRTALAQMREKPLGIAFAVAEEARRLGGVGHYGDDQDLLPQAFTSGFLLAERLETLLPGEEAVADVYARLHSLLALYFSARWRCAQARDACMSAERYAANGSGDLAVRANLHEVDILLAGDAEKAVETALAGLALVGEAPTWRRVELNLQLHGALVRLEAEPDQKGWVLQRTFMEVDGVKRSGDACDRLTAIHCGSLLILRLSRYLSDEERTAKLETARAELEAAEPLYKTWADSLTLRMRSRLLSFIEVSLATSTEPVAT